MKKFIAFLLLTAACFAEDFVNGSYYVKSASPNTKHNWVAQTLIETENLVVGKTYSSDTELFELITNESQEVSLQFSSGLLTKVIPGSEFRVDAFNQMISDVKVQPELLKSGDYILNVALMNGEAYFVAPTYTSSNTMCVLQTPLMNVELNGGKYHVKANQKYTIIYVLEGKINIFDNQTNKKTAKSAGIMVLIFPSPMKATDTMITEKIIESDERIKLLESVTKLENELPKVIFAVVDGKIVGIKL